MAGCQTLLIVAGESYTRRLWCVVEVFVYLEMGGEKEGITVIPTGEGANAREAVLQSFSRFRAEEAECFLADDRERLLAVIEASFGDFKYFDRSVRKIFGVSDEEGRGGSSKVAPAPP